MFSFSADFPSSLKKKKSMASLQRENKVIELMKNEKMTDV
jgi:hypothetical protein